jgi:hypothetical protein
MMRSRLLCFPSFAERVFGKFNEQYLAIHEYHLTILANLAHLKLEIENILLSLRVYPCLPIIIAIERCDRDAISRNKPK